jgi:PAS domain-containing protein
MFGLDPEGFTPSWAGFLAQVHPEDRQRVQASVESSLRTGEPLDYEHRLVTPTGAVRVYHVRGEVVGDGSGVPIQMIGTVLDVTERTRTEEVLRERERWVRTLFENAADGISVHDLSGRLLDVNERLCRELGYTREEMLQLSVERQ